MDHSRITRTAPLLAALGILAGTAACAAPEQQPPAWDAVVATDAGMWDTVPVTLTWSLAGTTAPAGFTVELPPELRPLVGEAEATAPDGSSVGRVEIDGGTARATWEAADDATATASTATAVLPMAWDAGTVAAGEDVALTFRAGDDEVRHEVRIRPDEIDPAEGRLYGYWADRANEDRREAHEALQWRYVTPVGTSTPVRLSVDDGQEISCEGVAFRALVDGEKGRELPDSQAPDVACSRGGLEVTLEPRSPDEALMLLVPATPVAAAATYTAQADAAPEPLESTVERVGGTAPAAAPAPASGVPTSWLLAAGVVVALAATLTLARASGRRPVPAT